MKDDSQSAGFEVLLGAFANFGEETKRNHRELMSAITVGLPLHRYPFGSAIVPNPTATVAVVATGKPPAGRMWNVRSMGIYGADGHTAITGSAEFYIGTAPQDTEAGPQANIADIVAPGIAVLPGQVTLSRHVYWARNGQSLYALVYGGVAGTQLSLVCAVEDWKIEDVEALHA